MNDKISSMIPRVESAGILLLIFGAPLVFDRSILNGFSAPKVAFCLSVFIIILAGFVAVRMRSFTPLKKTAYDFPVTALFLAYCASMVFSYNAHYAFEDMLWKSCFLILFIIIINGNIALGISKLLFVALIAVLAVSLYGILQYFGVDVKWELVSPNIRFIATFGNANVIAQYLLLAFPIIVSMIIKGSNTTAGFLIRILTLAAVIVTVILSDCQGVWISAAISIVFLFSVLLTRRNETGAPVSVKFRKYALILMPLLAVIFVVILSYSLHTDRNRLLIWKNTLQIIKENPAFGVGAGNYYAGYTNYYRCNDEREQFGRKNLVLQAHCDYLEIAAETGILGLGIFLYFVFLVFYRNLFLKNPSVERIGILSGIFGALVHSLIDFDLGNKAVYAYFWILAGILCADETFIKRPQEVKKRLPARYILIPSASLCAVAVILLAGKMLASEIYFTEGERRFVKKEWKNALEPFQKEKEMMPGSEIPHYKIADIYYEINQPAKSILEYGRVVDSRVLNSDFYFKISGMLLDKNNALSAKIYARKAIALDPNYAEAYGLLGNVYFQQGKYNEAIKMYEKTILMNPELVEPYNNLANSLVKLKRYEEAEAYYEEALKLAPYNSKTNSAIRFNLELLRKQREKGKTEPSI